ncbi:hypothetical protein [uncultured Friedmanniella sp.]|uniref:hypothetical protein n=1 Tax=uncultured Friedmanniella sp. TaxID=335381 RepID=UPI0035C94DC8
MTTTSWVDAGPFRAHLQHLMAIGDLSTHEVATLAGVSGRAAETLLVGRRGKPVRRISRATAIALLNVAPKHAESLRSSHVPAAEPVARLLRLLADGTTVAALADQLGVVRSVLDDLLDGSLVWCPALVALRLVVLTRSRVAPAPASTGSSHRSRAALVREAA